MTITDWIQALSTVALAVITYFYVRKINEGNKATKEMAEAMKSMAIATKANAFASESLVDVEEDKLRYQINKAKVFDCLKEGEEYRDILSQCMLMGQKLRLTPNSVKNYLVHLFAEGKIDKREDGVFVALEKGGN